MPQIENEQIDLIYCDILYGTGKRFKDYNDLVANEQVIYDFYLQRFQQMQRILKTNGTIYIQLDLRIVHWIRCIMDSVFGYHNFRNQIVVKFNIGGRGKRQFAKKHDYILVYTKGKEYTFNDKDIRIPYKSVVSIKQDRPNITQEKLQLGTVPTNVWDDIPSGLKVKKKTQYYSQKHEKILERIIRCSSNEGQLVGDFFLGSGTTAAVAVRNNRKFIGCDVNPEAVRVAIERVNSLK